MGSKIKYEFTNESDYFVVLGNFNKVISSWETKNEAIIAIDKESKLNNDKDVFPEDPTLNNTIWADISLVEPGETIQGTLYGHIQTPESIEQRELSSPSRMWADPSFLYQD
ncbi:hypothetical protein HUB98_06190 [Paenibacillus barcinonensis]|uniref:Uncharacterized protein n=1 Tax=Paenibacillus barcinonensis TaxID=198119 RepID=A0A2V4W8F8_PAEBA|nr:hypothetical protein [Paenibacillus barcinonensis]PYE51603.1 hypothetical protein DFQ00_102398 [Paenibacillus barcinonensis]QKS55970.1 hypothetical protein HUB98_06190 [Paenibacillus barcinonensis]